MKKSAVDTIEVLGYVVFFAGEIAMLSALKILGVL